VKRTVILLRHAKAAPAESTPIDRDRPLIERGIRDCVTIGAFLRKKGLNPEVILCSSAKRTQETLRLVAGAASWNGHANRQISDDLYLASADDLITAVQHQPATARSVMIVAHSPGIEEAAMRLAAEDDTPERQALLDKFPTCGLAVLEFDDDWSKADRGLFKLERFVTPRMLALTG